jgi:glycosidase
MPKIEVSRWIFLVMLTWGKLLGLAAEIHAQAKAEPGAKQPLLELIRTHAPIEAPDPSPAPSQAADTMAPSSPMAPIPVQRRVPGAERPDRPPSPAYDLLSLRIDPSQIRRSTAVAGGSTPSQKIEADVAAIESCFTASPDKKNPYEALAGIATREDLEEAKRLARLINPARWADIFVRFADELLKVHYARDEKWRERDRSLDERWHERPWYAVDPRWYFVREGALSSSFADVERGLDWVRHLGIENVALGPHYSADGLDTGASITDLSPARVLGGPPAFERLMERARSLGVRIATTAPFGYTSIHHKWFERALEGDERSLSYYLAVPDRSEGEPNDERTLIARIGKKEVAFRLGRRPFQAALDLRCPDLLGEIFEVLAREANQGSLGRIADETDGWTEVELVVALLKLFLALVAPSQVMIPGDAFFWLDASRALRESISGEDKQPVESAIERLPKLRPGSAPAVLLEHPEIGPRNATVHGGDPSRIALSIFCLYMMPGTPVINAGAEIGEEDNVAHAELVARWQEQYLRSLGAAVPRDLASDPVLRHHGALFARDFARRAQERYLPLETLRALNQLAAKHPALLGRTVVKIENTHKGVLSWVKSSEKNGGDGLLLVANLSKHTARLSLSAVELRQALGLARDRALQLHDALGPIHGSNARLAAQRILQGRVLITIPPSAFIALGA